MRGRGALFRYALRRLLASVPVLLGGLTLVFLLLHAAPGDPTAAYFHPDIPADVARQIRHDLGLDRSLPVQYLKWISSFVRGDFGYSFSRSESVARALAGVLPDTLFLGAAALALAFAGGIGLGSFQAARRGDPADDALSVMALTAYSIPGFWAALMLILLFSTVVPEALRLPVSGATSVDHSLMGLAGRAVDRARHLVLPSLALALAPAAGVARYVRASVLDALQQEYVTAARARGLSERRVLLRHALRNGLLPVVSLLGLYVPAMLGGTVVIEKVFAYPGMGRLLYESALARDYPVVLAATFVFGVLVVLGNLAADLLYGCVDPRVRVGAGET